MSPTSASNRLAQTARAEAAAWITRLHGPDRSPEMETGLQRWLSERPENAAEFEAMTDLWDLVDAAETTRGLPRVRGGHRLQESLAQAAPVRKPARAGSRWVWRACAAMVCAIVVVGFCIHLAPPTFTTDIGEQRVLLLDDGSRASLNAQTRLQVKFSAGRRTVRLQRGEVLFDVAKDPLRPFVVVIGDRQVTALGTSFVVRYEPDKTQVTLIEGKVRVSGLGPTASRASAPPSETTATAHTTNKPTEGDIVLTPGQRLQLAGTSVHELDSPPIDAVTAWRRGEVMLHDTSLIEAVHEMNRYDRTTIVIDDPRIGTHQVSGLYHAGDNEGFAQSVARMYGLEVVRIDGRIHLKE